MNKCKIIVFEGIDGAGKSTQAKKLNDLLILQNKKSIILKGYDLFNGIKEALYDRYNYIDPLETFFVTLSKHKAIEMQIKSIVHSFDYIIIDRFIYTTFAYTMANVSEECLDDIIKISKIIEPYFLKADYIFYIYTNPELAWERKNNNIDKIETGNSSIENKQNLKELFIKNQELANKYYQFIFNNKTNTIKLNGEFDLDTLSKTIYRKVCDDCG